MDKQKLQEKIDAARKNLADMEKELAEEQDLTRKKAIQAFLSGDVVKHSSWGGTNSGLYFHEGTCQYGDVKYCGRRTDNESEGFAADLFAWYGLEEKHETGWSVVE